MFFEVAQMRFSVAGTILYKFTGDDEPLSRFFVENFSARNKKEAVSKARKIVNKEQRRTNDENKKDFARTGIKATRATAEAQISYFGPIVHWSWRDLTTIKL